MDIYCNTTLVGTLTEEAQRGVFTYLPGTPTAEVVSLLMPVRNASYTWPGGIMPSFQMNLPEGFKKDLIRQKLGPHADVSDFSLLALTGANTIGRVRAIPRGAPLDTARSTFGLVTLLANPGSRDNLFKHLEAAITEGVSGAMPKTLASGKEKATVLTDEFILKTGPVDLPGLSVNEYLCLEVARNTELEVPETRLSEDGQVLAIRRFDLNADGTRLGVEDFCALKGMDPVRKYEGTIEDLAKLCNQYLGVDHRKDSKRKLFLLLLLNYALRNAGAHMKNYALTYTNGRDARLSPVYGIVTVTAYRRYQDDTPALPLKGKKVWCSGKALFEYGAARLSLSPTDMRAALKQVASAVKKVVPLVSEYAHRYPEFREVGGRMLDTWMQGLEDIKPDAKPRKGVHP
ncbi:type II toxin-antitoxin system HipA family toxin [Paraburkholderia acidiphila]|uniref:Type II toxin-antitoxin system HipA family toxin n=1 Tax=Paraburkholderia acidiphila TaxID=2571747 RepID=A0A7Z2G855_9BURK|nr:type II toxin-antitoxin system HipA family toxin [Paraburkholderia acidiphila]QGZ56861.1 type II toxin-antitoxin system HipA family toxin [Paraburkholderia acidiphila]